MITVRGFKAYPFVIDFDHKSFLLCKALQKLAIMSDEVLYQWNLGGHKGSRGHAHDKYQDCIWCIARKLKKPVWLLSKMWSPAMYGPKQDWWEEMVARLLNSCRCHITQENFGRTKSSLSILCFCITVYNKYWKPCFYWYLVQYCPKVNLTPYLEQWLDVLARQKMNNDVVLLSSSQPFVPPNNGHGNV